MPTILHLTDMHFGWEGDSPAQLAERKICLDGLLGELRKLEPHWKPTIVCLTGDIAWRGAEADYRAAKEWLDQLLEICGLAYESLIVCAGNHDVDQPAAEKLARPGSSAEADKVLEPPIAGHFEGPFTQYIAFCKTAGIPSLKFGEYSSHLVGTQIINGLYFVVLNSAWFCKDKQDKEKLWIGLPHLRLMEANEQLVFHPLPADKTTIALLHHPREFLHEDEICSYSSRPNTFDYLADRCHLVLTGHTHGGIRGADGINDHAWHFTGGSAYTGASHFNSFRLIQITSDAIIDRAFEFDPRSSEQRWNSGIAQSRPLSFRGQTTPSTKVGSAPHSLTDLRESCCKDALRHLEKKSRLLRQAGLLPVIVKRPVSLRVSAQRDQFDSQGRIVRAKDAEQTLSFYEAVRQARRTLLLGDLGTGKSTLAAQLVIETLERSVTAVAVFIPAKALRLAGQFTRRDLLDSIDTYVRGEICLVSPDFNLESILHQSVEVLVVFDGLDELARDLVSRLLGQAAALVENWPTIQVVSTARPVEMMGVAYADWRLVHTVALDDTAKRDFLQQELIADGVSAEHINERAAALLRSLKEVTALDSIANSPLAIRLIYPRLDSFTSSTVLTLGDLLYEVLVERLDGWQKRDDKPSAYLHFAEVLPTAEAKAEYLAVLAEPAASGKRLQRDEAKALLQEAAVNILGANRHRLADEALSCYEWLGLLSVSDMVEFPLQPLAETCAAAGLVARWHSQPDNVSLSERTVWRIVSFAAAIARRRGWMNALRNPISIYIASLLRDPGYLPAACYIVVEASDAALAVSTVQLIDNLEYRPLTSFQDERKASARNIAKTLLLAGDKGFEWFYQEYLDPRYPIPNAGSAVVNDVFAEWAALAHPLLTSSQKEKLAKMVQPYAATEEGHFFGVLTKLSVLVPGAFSPEDRFWRQSFALDSGPFADWVTDQLRSAHNKDAFRSVVEGVIFHRYSESLAASRLWLEWHKGAEPPYSIIRLALRSLPKIEGSASAAEVVTQCRERLGEERWIRFARWALATEEFGNAAGAAKVLYDAGERRLSILGDVLISSMHDGGYVAEAERVLSELVKQWGDHGVRWLARSIAEADEWHSGHSGWWRVLLGAIDTIEGGPELLGACVRNLGPFTLPRYPEVREGFSRLLSGVKGSLYKEVLRNRFNDLDPDTRRGAACILVSSDPRNEADALFVAVRSRSAGYHKYDWHEWESFCLTLDFGPSVLASLKSKLEFFEPQSRAFALVLLSKGGAELDPAHRVELMTTLASLGNWNLRRESTGQAVLAAESSFENLKRHLEHPASEMAQRAAEWLLEFHPTRLTPFEEDKCIVLRHGSSQVPWELSKFFSRLSREPDFAYNLITASKEICEQGGRIPLLGMIAKAITENTGWKDVLWALLCDDTRIGGSSESENGGITLLAFGLGSEKHRPLIGQAAQECLADPRLKQNRWHEAYHWLALLADEFDGLDSETIQAVIIHGKPIGYSATTALIARLGEVPEKFSCERGQRRCPALLRQNIQVGRDPSVVIQQLREFGRNSDELHPDVIVTIQESLFLSAFDESTLISISATGKSGILISAIFRFLYGGKQKMLETIPLLDLGAQFWLDERQKPHLKRLMRIWKMIRKTALFEDKEFAQEYLEALDRTLIEGGVWKLSIAWEIFEIRGSITDVQIPLVFTEYAEHSTFLHEVLFAHLCSWLSGEIAENARLAVVAAAENAIIILNEAPWHPKPGESSNPWANLLFPAIVWIHAGMTTDETEAVFLRGIRAIFDQIPSSHNVSKTNLTILMARLESLLAKVPPEHLAAVIRHGIESQEPSVSVFCRLIQSFGKHVRKDNK